AAYLLPPNLLKGIGILALLLVFMSVIGLISLFYKVTSMRSIHLIYIVGMALVMIYHIALIFLSYDYSSHLYSILTKIWANAPTDYRLYVQNK
ncbi:uncharacterized protein BX664DRAFT_376212, partial [Halteromyces radiatus]|uniref:uncharacterized protein n=1 Tax=Halteromyces radiatus TaxID=101107 RepID=UPI002220B26F